MPWETGASPGFLGRPYSRAMSAQMIDWDLAVATAARLAGPGPEVSRTEADEAVAELRMGAERSTPLVREFTGLVAEAGTAPVLVVDRPGWIQANADAFNHLITPVVEKLQAKRGVEPGNLTAAIGSRVTGLEVGALLGFLAGKVLGQFDPFTAEGLGRLLLVAPNIVHTERELGVDAADFRLWVCLHEETHRVQFTAVPWLRDHLQSEIDQLVDDVDVDPARVAAMLGDAVRRTGEIVRGTGGSAGGSLLDVFATPQQRAVIERVTAVMSLLEGHADVVMDDVGPEVIGSVAIIRERFNRRRKGTSSLDRLVRRLLGLDAKMAQYRDGARFVRAVLDDVGMDGLNKVWVEPAHLPSMPEIAAPRSWVRRVHG
jgi:coenzyme F420 biosynthesis associated uncharacterized protein